MEVNRLIQNAGKSKDKDKVAASRGKRKTHASSQSSFQIFRGAHNGGVVIGREAPDSSTFVTGNELFRMRNRRLAEVGVSEVGVSELSTQHSISDVSTKKNH